MNRQISAVALATLVMLAVLIVATTYWQTWASTGLAARQDNAIQRVAQFQIRRGLIYAADGKTLLAARVRVKRKDGHDAVLPPLSDEGVRLAGDRLLDAEPRARRPRAVRERRT